MISKAILSYVRISPRKLRYVIDLVRKKSVPQAQSILNGSPRRGGEIISKLLHQAVDAAVRNSHADAKNLFISKITADGGPTMKRFRAATMGRASTIRKRTSHVELELDLLKKNFVSPAAESKTAKAKQPADKKLAKKKLVGAK